MIGIQPTEFWNMSLFEFNRAVEGFKEFHGDSKSSPMQKDELQEMMEVYPD